VDKAKQSFILALIFVAVVIISRGFVIDPFTDSRVQANQVSGAQRWEYCAITSVHYAGDNFGSRWVAAIRYYQASGSKETLVEFVPELGRSAVGRDYGEEALAKAIAKLGNEGWEMVTKESQVDSNFKPFYFKRPKQ
jgi:hypothetical protein